MDISGKTIIELKAMNFDILVQIEALQKNLQTINSLISKKMSEETKPVEAPVAPVEPIVEPATPSEPVVEPTV